MLVSEAMTRLKERYSFPPARPGREPFYWCLESWGKELVKEVIRERDIRLMVEVGVFFGGSVKQWLETSEDLTVIGIDPWKTNWAPYFARTIELYERHIDYGNLDRASLHEQLDGEEATYECVLSNLWEYRDRFVPMRGGSPEKLYELRDLGVAPELVYIDSDKHGEDLAVCHAEFPGCVICGDDWTWNPTDGYPIRKAVLPFAEEHGYEVEALQGTWLLVPH